MSSADGTLSPLDRLVLEKYPYPIAANYKHLLDSELWPVRVPWASRVFELTLRIVALGVVSEYFRAPEIVRNRQFNEFLYQKLPHATLGTWKRILLDAVQAYGGHRDALFMTELYDLVWDGTRTPHRKRRGIDGPFDRLIQQRNALAHLESMPRTDDEWQEAGLALLGDLHQVLEQFRFLEHYDFIHVVRRTPDGYEVVLYKGLQITKAAIPPLDAQLLEPGWFYWGRGNQQFLLLHPLLIFSQDLDLPGASEETSGDPAIYDSFTKRAVKYLATVIQKPVSEQTTLGEFIQLYEQLEDPQIVALEKPGLDWSLLRQLATRLVARTAAGLRSKYDRDLYVRREYVHTEFRNFLASASTAFLVLGRSGVGKSNFLLSVLEEYQARDEACVLFYDGAGLPDEERQPLAARITADLRRFLSASDTAAQLASADIFDAVAALPGIQEMKLILLIDAANESPDAKELLRQVNGLISRPYHPWFKLVLTSRPEAWRAMKRGVKVAEHLFYRPGAQDGGDAIVDEAAVQLTPFTSTELRQAYENYRRQFDLQTPYEELPADRRTILSDPLALKLISRTFQSHAIPRTLRLADLYPRYVESLVPDERDVRFLERELLPLFISEGHYQKTITAEQIESTNTSSGQPLAEAIANDDPLPGGRQVNQSFANLADAEILTRLGTPSDFEIGFKYERFYDYFAGKRLYMLLRNSPDPQRFALDLIRTTISQPYIWGGARNAMLDYARASGAQKLAPLCFSEEQRVKEMMVDVLTMLGSEDSAAVGPLLDELIPAEREAGFFQRLTRWRGGNAEETDAATRNARKVAVEVAGDVGLTSVLLRAATQTSSGVVMPAVRSTYMLWQHQPSAGFEVLEGIAKKAAAGLLPDGKAFEPLLGLSMLMFFDSVGQTEVLELIRAPWRRVLGKYLLFDQSSRGLASAARSKVRELIFSAGTTFLFRLFQQFPSYSVLHYDDMAAFFKLGLAEKQLLLRMVRYMDVDGGYDASEMERDVSSAASSHNLFLHGVAIMGIVAHAAYDPLQFLPFLERLLGEVEREPASSFMYYFPSLVQVVLDRADKPDAVFEFFMRAVDACQAYHGRLNRVPGYNRDRANISPPAMYTGPCVLYQYQRTGSCRTEWLTSRVDAALERDDRTFFDNLLKTEVPEAGIEMRTPLAALDAVGYCFRRGNAAVDEMAESLLSRLRAHYPDEVDDFFEAEQVPEDVRLRIRVNEPAETIGSLLGIRTWNFVRDEMIVGSAGLRSEFMAVCASAYECKDLNQWAANVIRGAVNVIYGAEVLSQS